jgi:dipeptide/tripeptide permease
MVISSVPGVVETKGAIGAFILSLIVTGLGTGLFKANISPLVAEQYKQSKLYVTTTKAGERVVVDPSLTVSRVYMVSFPFFTFSNTTIIPSFLVFLSLYQYWSPCWSNFNDLLREGAYTLLDPEHRRS